MFRLTLLAISCVIYFAAATDLNDYLSDEYIVSLNEKQSSWVAGKNFEGGHRMMGVVRKFVSSVPRENGLSGYMDTHYIDDNTTKIPTFFDARDQWPNCTSIGQVWDQGVCSAGWAMSAASALTDRLCIKSNQTVNPILSPEDLMTCCTKCRFGCDVGYPNFAWDYMNESGITTGGSYQSDTGCKSYSIPPCGHYNESTQYPLCTEADPACISTCYKSCDAAATKKNANVTFKDNLYFAEAPYRVYPVERQIKLEIMENGPVQATFDVLTDFLNYKSGVYIADEDSDYIGYQSVKLIGWGTDDLNQSYWLAVNSWNSDWGDNGLFKALVNSTACTMESEVFAAVPILHSSDPDQPDEPDEVTTTTQIPDYPDDNGGVRKSGVFTMLGLTLVVFFSVFV